MNVELTRFRAREGAADKVAEWLDFLRANNEAVKETLEPEQMYVETIFSEEINGVQYLYWYSVQGEDAIDVRDSDHWLDEKHVEYWQACIDDAYPPVNLTEQVTFFPDRVRAAMRPLGAKS